MPSGISRIIAILVSDGSMDGTKAASAAKLGRRVVRQEQFSDSADPPAADEAKGARPVGPQR
jgi:hypothetical protein